MAQKAIHHVRHKFEKDSEGNPGWKIVDYIYWCGKVANAIQGSQEVDPITPEDRLRLDKQREKSKNLPDCKKCVWNKLKWIRL
ncbi:hypothetical protein D3C87_125430 [compost metagenome]